MSNPPLLLQLPNEILQHILSYVYPPWHLQIKLRYSLEIEVYFKDPELRAIPAPPPTAPLLVCKALWKLVKPLILSSFSGTINAFEKTGFKALPKPWRWVAPRVTRLCVPNHVSIWLWETPFMNSLPALQVVEFFEDFGTLRCNLGQDPLAGLLEAAGWNSLGRCGQEDCEDFSARAEKLLMDDKFNEYWAFRGAPYIPSGQTPTDPETKNWLGHFNARDIKVIVHTVFTFHLPDPTLVPTAPVAASNSPPDWFNWSKYKPGHGITKDLDVALAGCKEDLTVVRKKWICSLRAEDRVLW